MNTAHGPLADCVRAVLTDEPKTLDQVASDACSTDTVTVALILGELKTRGVAVCTHGTGLIPVDTWSLARRPR